jgi:hypothetical protein
MGGGPTHRGVRLLVGLSIALAAATGLVVPGSASADDKPTKAERQVAVMEKLLDEMLVDSPNFLVAGHDAAEGFAIEDYGAIFTFQASLTGWGWEGNRMGDFLNFWPFDGGKRSVVVIRGDKGTEERKEIVVGDGDIVIKDGEVFIKDGAKTKKLSEKDGMTVIDEKQWQEDQLKKYEAAKEELVGFLLEYGETLKAMPAGQSVRIVARMRNLRVGGDREVRSLTLRVSIDDLRAYGDGRLGESAARAKIEIKES